MDITLQANGLDYSVKPSSKLTRVTADDRKQTTLHFHGRVDVTAGLELPGSLIVNPAYAKDDASTANPGMMISPSLQKWPS